MSLCTKLLPRDWLSSEAAALCDSVESQVDADAAVKCALDSMLKLRLSKVLAAELCRRDTKHNPVLACALVSCSRTCTTCFPELTALMAADGHSLPRTEHRRGLGRRGALCAAHRRVLDGQLC